MENLLLTLTLILFAGNTLADGPEKNNTGDNTFSLPNNYQLMEVKMAALEAKLARQGAYNAALSARVAAQDARATACEKWRGEQEQRDAKILRDIQALRTSFTERSSNVSFMAVSSESSQTVAGYAAVKFGNVLHNVAPGGYGFDKIINRFRCPVDGVYAFHFSTTASSANSWYEFGIMKESALLSKANVYTYNSYRSLSASAVTPCNKGDYVYVKNLQSGSRQLYDYSETHFTGFKIY